MVLFFACIPFMVNCAFSATPTEWLQHHQWNKGRNKRTSKKFAPRCQCTYGNLPAHGTDVIERH